MIRLIEAAPIAATSSFLMPIQAGNWRLLSCHFQVTVGAADIIRLQIGSWLASAIAMVCESPCNAATVGGVQTGFSWGIGMAPNSPLQHRALTGSFDPLGVTVTEFLTDIPYACQCSPAPDLWGDSTMRAGISFLLGSTFQVHSGRWMIEQLPDEPFQHSR
jgi:hypothetical protein